MEQSTFVGENTTIIASSLCTFDFKFTSKQKEKCAILIFHCLMNSPVLLEWGIKAQAETDNVKPV